MSREAFHISAIIWQLLSETLALRYGLPWDVAPSCLPEITRTSSSVSPGWESFKYNRRMEMFLRHRAAMSKEFAISQRKAHRRRSAGFVIQIRNCSCAVTWRDRSDHPQLSN